VATLRIALFIVLAGYASAARAASEEDTDLLHRADQTVKAGLQQGDDSRKARIHFRDAAKQYEALQQRGLRNAELLRDQGNAYLLSGDLASAIRAYRRGLRLEPGDRIMQANLNYAREQVDYPTSDGFGRPPLDDWPPWLPRPTLSIMVASAVLAYGICCILFTRWWMTRRKWFLAGAATAGVLMIVPVLGAAHESWRGRQAEKHPLVVIAADGVALRNGNGLAYPARYDGKTLNRGVESQLLFERGDWLHIELAGGESGWVPKTVVLLDTVRTD
jgi:hypothetical protein